MQLKLAVGAKNPSSQQEEELVLDGSCEATTVTSFALTLPLCGLEDMMMASEQQPTSPFLCTARLLSVLIVKGSQVPQALRMEL